MVTKYTYDFRGCLEDKEVRRRLSLTIGIVSLTHTNCPRSSSSLKLALVTSSSTPALPRPWSKDPRSS